MTNKKRMTAVFSDSTHRLHLVEVVEYTVKQAEHAARRVLAEDFANNGRSADDCDLVGILKARIVGPNLGRIEWVA